MVEFLIVLAIAVAVAVAWITFRWVRHDSETPSNKPLEIKLKPDEPLETTAKLRLDQYRRGPGQGED